MPGGPDTLKFTYYSNCSLRYLHVGNQKVCWDKNGRFLSYTEGSDLDRIDCITLRIEFAYDRENRDKVVEIFEKTGELRKQTKNGKTYFDSTLNKYIPGDGEFKTKIKILKDILKVLNLPLNKPEIDNAYFIGRVTKFPAFKSEN